MADTTDLASYYFHQGTNYRAYDYLGCHLKRRGKAFFYTFRTWAPNAISVELISDFSGWDTPIPMSRVTDRGVWELVYKSAAPLEYKAYKFRIGSSKGYINKGDPYARFSKGGDDGASIILEKSSYRWGDSAWRSYRKKLFTNASAHYLSIPINIYELHLGSFIRRDNGSVLTYRELADLIAPYVKAMGYTHIEIMPIMEHPYDGSWGYQVCAFYAPTSRFGTPDDFKYFVDKMHRTGIGVILDWVSAHFPKDEWGLYQFDGQPLYEYQGKDRMESSSWGTRFFDLGREEVQSFLLSNALYYLREFHIDGLRVDAVASMLYLDYDRAPGEWIPNEYGTNISLEALAFFKKLNTAVFAEFPDALMIAEESGAYGGITRPIYNGGLGFSLKWNMGWANDMYAYLSLSSEERVHDHRALNFPIMYAFTENYCLPISHDEVVHGKRSFIDKMHGEYDDKFEQMRSALLLMMTFPGKKLTFMGTEFAQFREWNYADSLEWFMLDYSKHKEMREYVRALNIFYLSSPELWEMDFNSNGFEWILADEAEKCTVAFRRISRDGSSLIVIINFSDSDQHVRIPSVDCKSLDIVFSTRPDYSPNKYEVEEDEDGAHADIKIGRFSGVIIKENDGYIKIKI